MSYDVYFESEDDAQPYAEDWRNYTSNVSPMWYEALGQITLGDLIEAHPVPSDLLPHLERGIEAMRADPAKYEAMNPRNGWGDYTGALAYLEWMVAACRYYPARRVRVSR